MNIFTNEIKKQKKNKKTSSFLSVYEASSLSVSSVGADWVFSFAEASVSTSLSASSLTTEGAFIANVAASIAARIRFSTSSSNLV